MLLQNELRHVRQSWETIADALMKLSSRSTGMRMRIPEFRLGKWAEEPSIIDETPGRPCDPYSGFRVWSPVRLGYKQFWRSIVMHSS
jgi:hypothetical protein